MVTEVILFIALIISCLGLGLLCLNLWEKKGDLEIELDMKRARLKDEIDQNSYLASSNHRLLNETIAQAKEIAELKSLGPRLVIEHVNFDGVRVSRAVQIHHAGPYSTKGAIDEITKQAVKMGYMQMFDLIAPYLEVKMGEEWERIEKSPAKKVDPTTGATSQFITVGLLIGKRR